MQPSKKAYPFANRKLRTFAVMGIYFFSHISRSNSKLHKKKGVKPHKNAF